MNTPPGELLAAHGISRRDPLGGATLLEPTDLVLAGGDRIAITGRSGSGKSVLLRSLALLDPLDGGSITWGGHAVRRDAIPRYRRQICYLGQRAALFAGSVEDNLRYPFSFKVGREQRFEIDKVLALLAQADRDAGLLARRASELSGGEAQIVAVVRVLQLAPQVILLDEPTASLDPESAQCVERLIDAWCTAQRAYLWVSHDPEQALRVGVRQWNMAAGRLSERR